MVEELKIRYKHAKLSHRLVLVFVVAVLPALLLYLEESSVVDEEFSKVESEEKAAAQKLIEADRILKNLSKAESDLAFTRDQLLKAESRLPSNVITDEILRLVGKSAKKFGVNIVTFEPMPEVVRGDDYKFGELPFKISVEGNDYGQIVEWLDDVSGMRSHMFLKSWKISRRSAQNQEQVSQVQPATTQELSPSQLAERAGRIARENLRLVLDAEFAVYKLSVLAPTSRAAGSTSSAEATLPANERKAGNIDVSDKKQPQKAMPSALDQFNSLPLERR